VTPALAVQLARIARDAPTVGAPATILGVVFGGFVALVVIGTALLPWGLGRLGREEMGVRWRRAALQALDFAPFFLLLWAGIYVPLGTLGARLGVSVVGCVATFLVVRYVGRRWGGVEIFGGRAS
jgi:hypothetical protein